MDKISSAKSCPTLPGGDSGVTLVTNDSLVRKNEQQQREINLKNQQIEDLGELVVELRDAVEKYQKQLSDIIRYQNKPKTSWVKNLVAENQELKETLEQWSCEGEKLIIENQKVKIALRNQQKFIENFKSQTNEWQVEKEALLLEQAEQVQTLEDLEKDIKREEEDRAKQHAKQLENLRETCDKVSFLCKDLGIKENITDLSDVREDAKLCNDQFMLKLSASLTSASRNARKFMLENEMLKKENKELQELTEFMQFENQFTLEELKSLKEQIATLEREQSFHKEKKTLEERKEPLLEKITPEKKKKPLEERSNVKEGEAYCEEEKRILKDETIRFEEQQYLEQQKICSENEKKRLEEENRIIKEERKKLEKERTSLEQQKTGFEQEKTSLEEEKRILKEQTKALEEGKTTLQQERTGLEKEKAHLKEENAILDDKISCLEKGRTTSQEEENLLRASNEKLLASCQAMKEESSALNVYFAKLHRRNKASEEQLATSVVRSRKIGKVAINERKRRICLANKYDSARKNLWMKKKRFNIEKKARNAFGAMNLELQLQVQLLSSEAESFDEERSCWQHAIKSAAIEKLETTELIEQNAALEGQIKMLKNILSEKSKDLQSKRSDFKQLRAELVEHRNARKYLALKLGEITGYQERLLKELGTEYEKNDKHEIENIKLGEIIHSLQLPKRNWLKRFLCGCGN